MRWSVLLRSFGYALAGLSHAVRTQQNVRVQLTCAAAVVAVAAWLHIPGRDWAVLCLSMGLVIAGEIGNTALEAVVNLVSPDYHPLAKIAKDSAAAAVLVLALTAAVVGLLILGPPLLAWYAG